MATEFQVNTYPTLNQGYPSVASAGADSFVVVWSSDGQDGDDWGIFGQRFGPCIDDTVPPNQGNRIRAVKSDNDVFLSFPAAPATTWRLFRDPNKTAIGVTELTPDVLVTAFTDGEAVPTGSGQKLFYYVRGLSPCSLTPGP